MNEEKQNGKRISDPLKAVIAVALFFVCAAVFIGIIILPFERVKMQDYDTLIIGSSETKWGMNAAVLKDNTGCRVINLSSGPAAIPGRYELLKGALLRYHPDTVVLDVCYDSFNAMQLPTWSSNNSIWIIPRMVSAESAWVYTTQLARIPWYDFGMIWGAAADLSYDAWNHILHGNYGIYQEMAYSGYAEKTTDLFADEEEISLRTRKAIYFEDRMSYNQAALRDMLDLLSETDVRVIMTTVPSSEMFSWYNSGVDRFWEEITQMAEEYDVEYYDFNLYKGNADLFDDRTSFRDETHLNGESAKVFSELFAREVLGKNREDVTIRDRFYTDYADYRNHSVYSIRPR